MPSLCKTLGAVLVVVGFASPTAQTAQPGEALFGPSQAASASDSPSAAPHSGLTTDSPRRVPPRRPRPGPLAGGDAAARPPVRTGVVAASYEEPAPAHGQPLGTGQAGQRSGQGSASVPLSPRTDRSALPLPAPDRSGKTRRGATDGISSAVTIVGSLALVLGIFFLVAWAMRRAAPAGSAMLPGEVFEVLGRAVMGSRQQVHLLRCGNKLVLVSVTPAGAETLTEITDPAEVDRLAGLCRQAHPNSATAAFRQVLGQFASQRPGAGPFGRSGHEDFGPASASAPGAPHGLESRDA